MFILKLALAIIQLVLSVLLTAVVLLQQSRRAGLSGTISGAAETFFSKNKTKGLDSLLVKLTVILSAIFIIVTLVLNLGFIA
ncbi:MAG: preprotein translocase subunit SecG [Oscillospiraceae bacterium]|nr:preprotein translocase subunit SecG [Oscillospiraceae bacterium]